MNAAFNKGIISIEARDEKDMENVEQIVSTLVNEFGYEDVSGSELEVTVGATYGQTIKEMRAEYDEAKTILINEDE